MKFIGFFLVSMTVIGFSCGKSESYHRVMGMIWNTEYHITYKGKAELEDSILPVLNEVGKSLSVFDKNSLVSKLNSNDRVKTDIHLAKVYDKALSIHRKSEGRFDPTVSPLIDAWGFGKGHTPTQDTLAIDSLMPFVGMDKTYHSGEFIIKKDPRISFNFSAIAKGYGCDALGEMFTRNGVKDYMIEIGGEIVLRGESPSGKDWRIGIDSPVEDINPGEETSIILSLTDVGIATSGNYRNYRLEGGEKKAHTISPITGRPFLSEVLSATIIASTCMEADAIATACMAGTTEEAKKLIVESGVEGILIFADSIWTNKKDLTK